MACNSLSTTSLLQVVNRLVSCQDYCQNLLSTSLLQVVSTSCNKSGNDNDGIDKFVAAC